MALNLSNFNAECDLVNIFLYRLYEKCEQNSHAIILCLSMPSIKANFQRRRNTRWFCAAFRVPMFSTSLTNLPISFSVGCTLAISISPAVPKAYQTALRPYSIRSSRFCPLGRAGACLNTSLATSCGVYPAQRMYILRERTKIFN